MREHLGEDDIGEVDAAALTTGPRKRLHRATYSSDKRNGGYLVRIAGPYPEKFAGKDVPVSTKSGGEHEERLTRLIWTGTDRESGEKVALYKFESQPREAEDAPF